RPSEPACHRPALLVLSPSRGLPREDNGGSGCCHCPIRRPRPITGSVRLRMPPGGMSARLRAGSLGSMKAGACMKPDFAFLGSCCPVTGPSSSVGQGCHGHSWESTGIFAHPPAYVVSQWSLELDLAGFSGRGCAVIDDRAPSATTYRQMLLAGIVPANSQKSAMKREKSLASASPDPRSGREKPWNPA